MQICQRCGAKIWRDTLEMREGRALKECVCCSFLALAHVVDEPASGPLDVSSMSSPFQLGLEGGVSALSAVLPKRPSRMETIVRDLIGVNFLDDRSIPELFKCASDICARLDAVEA